ncbi:hypothetical protein ABZZ79_31730 [Streptomyces sp. NPDC006458]|uniref:hypothetical protein n=1 Tax=Streptomyces sp. NPDC006458 TaxID=3154302 RepID=UPI0033AFADA0
MGSDSVMGTAERRGTPGQGAVAQMSAPGSAKAPDRDIAVRTDQVTDGSGAAAGAVRRTLEGGGAGLPDGHQGTRQLPAYRQLWMEEPAKRRRLADPVRRAAVRAVLIIALTLIQAMIAFLCALAGSWLAFPMVLSSVASTVVATWGALDVWVTRQVWSQRNGVVSEPSSTARALRRERRRARRQERSAARAQGRIRRPGRAGRLSHP